MRCLYLAAPARPGLSLVVRSVRPAAPRRPGGVHLPVRPTTPRRSLSARAATDDDAPSTAREAIDAGIARLDAGDADGSLALFTQALTLPGRGLKRFRDKPAGVSDGEKQAALYNIACAHARLGNVEKGLEAIAGCLEAGYEETAILRSDPDLAPLRADPRLEGLIARLVPAKPGGLGGLFNGFFGK